jgi:DNA-binding MarR family transcriptional regulator
MSENEELGRAIKAAQWRHERVLDTRLRAVGSTLPQWVTLRAIDTLPGASGHELAMATFQSDQSFGTLATRLLAQQLITRRPGEGRRIQHHLTAKGKALLESGRSEVGNVFRVWLAGLSATERAQLRDLLGKIGDGP